MVDPLNEQPKPNDIERLLEAAASDPAERPAFAQALLAHEVFVLGRTDPSPVDGLIPPDAKMRFLSLEDAHGTVLPFFTSLAILEAALAAWPGTDPAFLCLSCRQFFEITRGSRLVLNPNAAHGKHYEPGEVAALLDGRDSGLEEVPVTDDLPALVGAARTVPPELPAALARFFVQRPAVEAAHLGWWYQPDGHQGYLVGVVSSDRKLALEGFGQLEVNQLTGGASLDVCIFAPGTRDGMPASLPPPFYVRAPQVDLSD
jgi:hypothetical protein